MNTSLSFVMQFYNTGASRSLSYCIDAAKFLPSKERYKVISIPQRGFLFVLLFGLIAGCTSTPTQKPRPTTYLNSSYYQKLEQTPLPKHLPIPVEGVSPDQLTDTWGNARSRGRVHLGIDIMAKRGTPILSATDGIVMKIGTGGAGGNAVTIVSYALSQQYYAHLDRFGKFKVGDIVHVGDVLGYVGKSGNATTDHLHYGIYLYPNREAINPYPYLR
jgi:murein DD-endopeptidase MepM/ murein hydrolase activator NlpD